MGRLSLYQEATPVEDPKRKAPKPSRGGGAPPPRPPRTGEQGARPRKPELPRERPHLPREVHADVRSTAPSGAVDDLARALGAAEEAIARGDAARAVDVLAWAKSVATRSWAVREALGIALYLEGRFAEAQRELLTYRRLSGRHDQNHLLADCARATGKIDQAVEHVEAMIGAGVEEDRIAEGLIVVAGARLEGGEPDGALAVLRRLELEVEEPEPYHLRLWHLAARAAREAGQEEAAQRWRARIAEVDADALAVLDGESRPR